MLLQSRNISVRTIKTRQYKPFVNNLYKLLVVYIDFVDIFLEKSISIFSKNSKVKHSI